jgi:transcriptional regulator with XRE-family HTH domain
VPFNQPTQRRGGRGHTSALSRESRVEVGNWLRALREESGLTQKELGAVMGGLGGGAVSAIETAYNTLAPEHYETLAKHYGIEPARFAQVMLRYTDPWLYLMLVRDDPALRERLAATAARTGRVIESQRNPDASYSRVPFPDTDVSPTPPAKPNPPVPPTTHEVSPGKAGRGRKAPRR